MCLLKENFSDSPFYWIDSLKIKYKIYNFIKIIISFCIKKVVFFFLIFFDWYIYLLFILYLQAYVISVIPFIIFFVRQYHLETYFSKLAVLDHEYLLIFRLIAIYISFCFTKEFLILSSSCLTSKLIKTETSSSLFMDELLQFYQFNHPFHL